uniref:Uncharacterized protein n=1 Tax=Arundo donax TaxID=35708 RepID=A0A0A9DGZ3_ARUDO
MQLKSSSIRLSSLNRNCEHFILKCIMSLQQKHDLLNLQFVQEKNISVDNSMLKLADIENICPILNTADMDANLLTGWPQCFSEVRTTSFFSNLYGMLW